MCKARFFLAFIAAMALGGCGDSDESVKKAESGAEGAHHTLGTWPNVVVDIDRQQTAADIMVEIMNQAFLNVNNGTLSQDDFKKVVGLIVDCAQKPLALPHSQHAAFLVKARDEANKNNAAAWVQCLKELDHGH